MADLLAVFNAASGLDICLEQFTNWIRAATLPQGRVIEPQHYGVAYALKLAVGIIVILPVLAGMLFAASSGSGFRTDTTPEAANRRPSRPSKQSKRFKAAHPTRVINPSHER
ncbi:MAG: hypothetical protein V3S68_02680 [Dehalococcoidia bacterium]